MTQLGADACMVESRGGGGGLKIIQAKFTTITAADVINLEKYGITRVLFILVSLETDAALACDVATAVAGTGANQKTFTLKTWKRTSSADCTPIAATAFSKVVNYIAFCE